MAEEILIFLVAGAKNDKLYVMAAHDFVERHTDKVKPCDFCPQPKLVDQHGEPSKIYSWDYQRPFDGAWFRVLSGTFRWLDGRLAHVVSSVDITENKNNEALIARLANYDPLTNLPNRRKLMADCEHLIQEA